MVIGGDEDGSVPCSRLLPRYRYLGVVAQAEKTRVKLKAMSSFSQSKFESEWFQGRVSLECTALLERRPHSLRDKSHRPTDLAPERFPSHAVVAQAQKKQVQVESTVVQSNFGCFQLGAFKLGSACTACPTMYNPTTHDASSHVTPHQLPSPL